MLTAAAEIDLTDLDEYAAKRRCGSLDGIPDGARLIVRVGNTYVVPYEAAHLIAPHVDRLNVEIRGNAGVIQRWLKALRGEDFWRGEGP